MQVRDLIEELKRFDPRAEVRASHQDYEINENGKRIPFTQVEKVDGVSSRAGEPLLVCESR